ncbi:MAG TPA: hypothetical protein VHR45_20780 [Thermoanaerobaculia bacterium]|nr:hypothetical protein [Thermoanaerobaculia bacterium]
MALALFAQSGVLSGRSAAGPPGPSASLAAPELSQLVKSALLPGRQDAPRLGPEVARCALKVGDYKECHSHYPVGCSRAEAPRFDAYLNLLKNQLVRPELEPLRFLEKEDFEDLDQQTPKELKKSNHKQLKDRLTALGEGRVHGLFGYLYYAHSSPGESSNCQASRQVDSDFHIGIGFDPELAGELADKLAEHQEPTDEEKDEVKRTSVIVEMTPHQRALFRSNWTLRIVKAAIGRQVRVVGQLLIDSEHNNRRDNCALGNQDDCWRASVWELHPVTRFQVCKSASCTTTSGDWVDVADLDKADLEVAATGTQILQNEIHK